MYFYCNVWRPKWSMKRRRQADCLRPQLFRCGSNSAVISRRTFVLMLHSGLTIWETENRLCCRYKLYYVAYIIMSLMKLFSLFLNQLTQKHEQHTLTTTTSRLNSTVKTPSSTITLWKIVENSIVHTGRYINPRDIDEYRKVAVIGDKVKEDIFGDIE